MATVDADGSGLIRRTHGSQAEVLSVTEPSVKASR